ncbi:MAG: Arginine--tRNA ligase [Planctomycetes bacterium ADurb.Bin412]|nr:MAG: Arginine--tRNA ligase [Planctomycetes bacterium ADurb.Bin412]
MKPIIDILEQRVSDVMAVVAGESADAPAAIIKSSANPQFGDYQANGVMALAKKIKQNPRELAQQIVAKLDVGDMCEPPEVAGPGFINFRLKPGWLAQRLTEAICDPRRLGIDSCENPPTTVVDFSGPNIAKQMHVGHLRSTIIGDTIARVLEFWYGNPDKVIRQNHVGDWGTQFGMLVQYLIQHRINLAISSMQGSEADSLANLEDLYRKSKESFDNDPQFAASSRDCVVKLHNKDSSVMPFWQSIVKTSLDECQKIYDSLGVNLTEHDVRGESFYNDKLPSVISELSAAKLLQESDGAQCVFLDGFKTKEGEPLPMIVQKSDGAYLYATTDLAAIQYRVGQLRADRIIYVTDSRQKLHFEMLFACVRQAGWAGESVRLEHVPFGSVLGDDGKPFKTRSGENVKLKSLLDEAELRARQVVEEKNPDLPPDLKQRIAHAVGVGAVKYADLSNNLVTDYIFNWDKMLAMEGNTAPYMQYAYARVQSIFRKGQVDVADLLAQNHSLELAAPEEIGLAKLLLRYGEVVETVARDLRPHLLTTYLFDLAQTFSGFYTNCPVLKAEGTSRNTRLLLCYQTGRTIQHGLGLLGIETIEQM